LSSRRANVKGAPGLLHGDRRSVSSTRGQLTYRYAGHEFRLSDVYGDVVHDILDG
jgi:hypothetical protein